MAGGQEAWLNCSRIRTEVDDSSFLGKRERGGAVVIGTSSTKYLQQTLLDLENGLYQTRWCRRFDDGWPRMKRIAGRYWH